MYNSYYLISANERTRGKYPSQKGRMTIKGKAGKGVGGDAPSTSAKFQRLSVGFRRTRKSVGFSSLVKLFSADARY